MRLIHGECLEQMKTIADGSIDMVLTDPPYGTTACKWDSIIPLEPMWEQLKRITKKNGAIVMTASQPFTTTLIASNMKMFKYCWVWQKSRKTGFLNAKKQPLRTIEDVVVFYGKQCTYIPQVTAGHEPTRSGAAQVRGDGVYMGGLKSTGCKGKTERYPTNVIVKKSHHNGYGRKHPTQKPVALMEYLIKTYTSEDETVLDFTMGSGTTGVACANLNRDFIGIEQDDKYFQIAEQRIEAAHKEQSQSLWARC